MGVGLTGSFINSGTANPSLALVTAIPDANALHLVSVTWDGSATSAATVSGWGLTWTQLAWSNSPPISGAVYYALGGSPTSGTLSVVTSGNSVPAIASWNQFGGTATSDAGTGAIVQSNVSQNTSSSISVTLSAFASTTNAAWGAFMYREPGAATVGSGFTSAGFNSGTRALFNEYKLIPDTTVDASYSVSSQTIGMAIEIRSSVGSASTASARIRNLMLMGIGV